ncbi:MAG: hypothetical protein N2448_04515 [Caloramator sp.]|nr:hypothetical protein [Caloramator sp.]
MKIKTEYVCGKKRVIIIREATGIDKTKEAILKVMGEDWEFNKGYPQNNKKEAI